MHPRCKRLFLFYSFFINSQNNRKMPLKTNAEICEGNSYQRQFIMAIYIVNYLKMFQIIGNFFVVVALLLGSKQAGPILSRPNGCEKAVRNCRLYIKIHLLCKYKDRNVIKILGRLLGRGMAVYNVMCCYLYRNFTHR